jgi:ion channel-forming bestrophin family protein
MVIRPRPSLLQLFFILRGSIIKRIFPQILITSSLAALVVCVHKTKPDLLPLFDGGPFALIGIALSIFLGFRNSACYERWWEARRQFGSLVAAARQLERQTLILRESDKAGRERLLRLDDLRSGFGCAFAPRC